MKKPCASVWQLKAEMSPAALAHIGEQARALELKQDAPDDSHLLPSVGIADVPEDMTYLRLLIPPSRVHPPRFTTHERSFLCPAGHGHARPRAGARITRQLILELLTEVGCSERDYQQNQALQVAVTGGISAQLGLRAARRHQCAASVLHATRQGT